MNWPVHGAANWDQNVVANSVIIDNIFGIPTCGDTTHAVGWDFTLKKLTCQAIATGGGSGTVTSFSAGNLSPLFTTSVATSTTIPALTFALSTFAAHTFYGNNTGSTATPGAQAIGEGDVTNLTADLALKAALASPTFTGTVTLPANQTLTTPTIANFLNATHNHSNAAGGGQLSLTTCCTGILPVANGGSGTATPALVAGTNISITGSWPNQTINSSGGSGLSGLTTGFLPKATSATAIGNSLCDEGITTANTLTCTDSAGLVIPMVQTTTTNGGFDGLEGTGGSLTAATNHDLLFPSASLHRWMQNPNNLGLLIVPGIATAGTSGNCVKLATNGIDLVDSGGVCPSAGAGTINTGVTNALPKYTAATTLDDSLLSDDATTLTYTGTGGFSGPSYTGTSTSVAATVNWGQGTKPASATTAITEYAPTSVTSYFLAKPGAAATGLVHWTNSAGTVTQTVSAVDLSGADATGTMAAARMPALTGDATTSAGAVAVSLAAPFKKRSCEIVWGGTGAANVLSSGDDAIANQSCLNKLGVTETITAVYCRSDSASNTTTVHPTFGTSGTGTTILSGALTCGSSGAYSATGTVSNGALVDGANINPVQGGTLTGTSIHLVIVYTVPNS